jgi:hypothetical protein
MSRFLVFLFLISLVCSASYAQKIEKSLLDELRNQELIELLNTGDDSLKIQILMLYEFKIPIYHPLSKLRLNSNLALESIL